MTQDSELRKTMKKMNLEYVLEQWNLEEQVERLKSSAINEQTYQKLLPQVVNGRLILLGICVIHESAIIRTDMGYVIIEEGANLQECTVHPHGVVFIGRFFSGPHGMILHGTSKTATYIFGGIGSILNNIHTGEYVHLGFNGTMDEVHMGSNIEIGHGFVIAASLIGDNVRIGIKSTMANVKVGNNVIIGNGVEAYEVQIGNNVKIGHGAEIYIDIPDYSYVKPGTKVTSIEQVEQYEKEVIIPPLNDFNSHVVVENMELIGKEIKGLA